MQDGAWEMSELHGVLCYWRWERNYAARLVAVHLYHSDTQSQDETDSPPEASIYKRDIYIFQWDSKKEETLCM